MLLKIGNAYKGEVDRTISTLMSVTDGVYSAGVVTSSFISICPSTAAMML